MTLKRLFDLLLAIAVGFAIVAGIAYGLRLAAGTTGMGLPALDVVFVPQGWFTPTRVTLLDASSVRIEGVTQGLTWSAPPDQRQWIVGGSTLVLTEGAAYTYPVRDDGTVIVDYTFGGQQSLGQAAGWRVVRITQRDGALDRAAAFVVVDLTKRVWLRRTGPVQFTQTPME